MAAPAMHGPGMLWVNSRISPESADVLSESLFLKWYDDEHIDEIVRTSGIDNAFRYVHVEKTSALGNSSHQKPFLAFYPMEDLGFTLSDEFKAISVRSDSLPGTGIIYDMADFDVAYYGLVNKTEAKGKKEPAQYLVVSGIETTQDTSDEEVNKVLDQQTAVVSQAPNYLRTLRFRLQFARTNAQSRALKGLPTTNEPSPEPPTWQAVHEFSVVPEMDVIENLKNDPNEVVKKAKQNEVHVYRFAKSQGEGKFFEQ